MQGNNRPDQTLKGRTIFEKVTHPLQYSSKKGIRGSIVTFFYIFRSLEIE
jgi:hypothetical protein